MPLDASPLHGILLACAACLLGMMSPGPNVLSVMGTSMDAGRRAGMALALGISAGSFLWATLTAFGLTALLAAYASLLTAIKVAGGLYLLWLALKAFRSAASPADLRVTAGGADTPLRAHFLRGLTVQMTNPKAALTWTATMSLGLGAGAPWWAAPAIVAGTTLLSLAGHQLYALAFSTERMVALYARVRRPIQAALGAFFLFAGAKLLTGRA